METRGRHRPMETPCFTSIFIISTFSSGSFCLVIALFLSIGFKVSHVDWRFVLLSTFEDRLHTLNELFSEASLLVGRFLLLLLRVVNLSVFVLSVLISIAHVFTARFLNVGVNDRNHRNRTEQNGTDNGRNLIENVSK